MNVLVINGPNLNLLGTREPEIYGADTLPELERRWRRHGARLNLGIRTFQSNHEGEIIDHLHAEGSRSDGIVLNAGALSHTSYAIHDALVAIGTPTVEVHISNIHERESWRARSVTAPAAELTIVGRGPVGYLNAIDHLWARSSWRPDVIEYGDHADQRMDIRVPTGARGAVALLHGGFWREIWGKDIMDPLAVHLAQDGWLTANIEYRRGPDAFDDATSDVAAALAMLRSHLATHDLHDRPLVVVGHSAGGYLAIRYAASEVDVRAVGLAPVIDIDGISDGRPDDDPIARFLGGARSERADRWTEASILDRAPQRLVIVHGEADDSVPVAHSNAYAARHADVGLRRLEDVDHMSLIDPSLECFDEVRTAIAEV